jgi:hypothetical protein
MYLVLLLTYEVNVSRLKGHGMLAPFTAGWESNDLHPLIIDRSEVVSLSFSIIWITSFESSGKYI